MKWFAAHVIMAVQLKSADQTRFPVWENIVLIAAKSEREAFAKAEAYGRAEEGDDDGTFCWSGHPATWVFAGVRKVTECATLGDRPDDGTEISFNELELDSLQEVERLAAGRPTSVVYNDRYRPSKAAKRAPSIKQIRKKGA